MPWLEMFKRTLNRGRKKEWPEIEVLLRRVRIDSGSVLSCEEILGCAASAANESGLTPYEVLIRWVKSKRGNFYVRLS